MLHRFEIFSPFRPFAHGSIRLPPSRLTSLRGCLLAIILQLRLPSATTQNANTREQCKWLQMRDGHKKTESKKSALLWTDLLSDSPVYSKKLCSILILGRSLPSMISNSVPLRKKSIHYATLLFSFNKSPFLMTLIYFMLNTEIIINYL